MTTDPNLGMECDPPLEVSLVGATELGLPPQWIDEVPSDRQVFRLPAWHPSVHELDLESRAQ